MKWDKVCLLIIVVFLSSCQFVRDSNLIAASGHQNKNTPPYPLSSPTSPRSLLSSPSISQSEIYATPTISSTDEIVFRVDGLLEKNENQFAFIEVTKPITQPWELLENSTGEYRAFHLCTPACGIFIEEVTSGVTYEVFIIDLQKYRNFKDMSWPSTYILEFKQVTSPDIAVRYVIDVKEQKLLDITLHKSLTTMKESITATPRPGIYTVSPIHHIGFGREFYDLTWSPDSQILFSGLWSYDLENGMSQELTLKDVSQETAQPDILSLLPSEALGKFVSPDGNRVLYFVLTTPTPTPMSEGMGESGYYEMRAELWLRERDGKEQRLGEVEFCGYRDPFWIDEQKVIIPNGDYLDTCGPTQAWLVDLQNNKISALFPREIYQSPVRIYGLSPNGRYLLHSVPGYNKNGMPSNPLFVLDMNTDESTPLLIEAHGEQWLTNEKILISFWKSTGLGIYDWKTSELIELTPMFKDECIRFPTVSPDLKWLAFATGEEVDACNTLTDLWLMELNFDG